MTQLKNKTDEYFFLSFNLGESRLADPEPQNNNCPNAPELRGLDTNRSQNITFQCIESDIKKEYTKIHQYEIFTTCIFCVP